MNSSINWRLIVKEWLINEVNNTPRYDYVNPARNLVYFLLLTETNTPVARLYDLSLKWWDVRLKELIITPWLRIYKGNRCRKKTLPVIPINLQTGKALLSLYWLEIGRVNSSDLHIGRRNILDIPRRTIETKMLSWFKEVGDPYWKTRTAPNVKEFYQIKDNPELNPNRGQEIRIMNEILKRCFR